MKKIISLLLAVLMATSMLLCLFPAATESVKLGDQATYDTLKAVKYLTQIYATPEAKLQTMTKALENDNYALYVQEFTAEICVVDKHTGQMLFSNPYDAAESKASNAIKYQILSQVIIGYYDDEGNYDSMESYFDGALEEQIVIKLIRGGVRVEYTMGAATKKRIVPFQAPLENFKEKIMRPFFEETTTSTMTFDEYFQLKISKDPNEYKKAEEAESFEFGKFIAFYTRLDLSDPSLTAREQASIRATYPITEKMPIYAIDESVTTAELNTIESYLREYTEYSLEDMLSDHDAVGYEMENSSPAIFRLALEYTLEEDGLQVRLPARGISYDAATYTLDTIQILPFFGAGRTSASETASRQDTGYNFVPDGSGSIIDFKQNTRTTKVSSTIYGIDFGFYTGASSTTASYQTWRAPVYGTVMTSTRNTANGMATVKEGYVAFITEGESLTRVDASDGGSSHEYHSVSTTFFARQTDSYPLDGITVSGNVAIYTKAIERKYVGNYTIKYRLLWGDEADYVGMANAFRAYLEKEGVLSKMENTNEDITLYMDLLGAITTSKKFLGMPVITQSELTTFENAKTIFDELKEAGITNQSLRYLGWRNGGLYATAPTKIKVEKVLGGESELKELISYVQQNGAQIYMDFDFSYLSRTDYFDGFDDEEHTAKTIDGKPAMFKEYDPVIQAYNSGMGYLLSPHTITEFHDKISEKYQSLFGDGQKNISVATLGYALNSSQDEERPLNRENSKEELMAALENLSSQYDSLMIEGGNYYTWKYADTILDIPLDSSNRRTTTAEVPFIGIVLHGYKNYAGEAINLAGDYEYTLLKTIENGANPYFVVAYQNIPELKINYFSEYYAVEYGIWKESIIEEYNRLNKVLAPLQNATIVDHEILSNRIVKVSYSNGVTIYLNYNNYEVTHEGKKIDAMGFLVANA